MQAAQGGRPGNKTATPAGVQAPLRDESVLIWSSEDLTWCPVHYRTARRRVCFRLAKACHMPHWGSPLSECPTSGVFASGTACLRRALLRSHRARAPTRFACFLLLCAFRAPRMWILKFKAANYIAQRRRRCRCSSGALAQTRACRQSSSAHAAAQAQSQAVALNFTF